MQARPAKFSGFSRFLLIAVSVLGFWSPGCGTAKHPADALGDYVAAVQEKNVGAVWDMLGEEQRAGLSEAEFEAFFAENYDDILAEAELIDSSIRREEFEIRAGLPVGSYNELDLSYESEQWRLETDKPVIAGAGSPKATLVALADAIDNAEFSDLLLLMSSEKSETLRAELALLRSSLANVEEDDIVVTGDRATVYLDWNIRLDLVMEDGAWRLQDVSQP